VLRWFTYVKEMLFFEENRPSLVGQVALEIQVLSYFAFFLLVMEFVFHFIASYLQLILFMLAGV
jgi:hypothetical protein